MERFFMEALMPKKTFSFKCVSQSEFMAFICILTLSLTDDGFKVL